MKTKTFSTLILAIAIVSIISSCATRKPFTNTVRTQYNLDASKLKKLQFFISQDVTLQRGESTAEQQELEDGKLVISSSASLDKVDIEAGTLGGVVKVLEGNKLAVSFHESDDSKYLVFGDPNNRGRYTLMGAEWKQGKGKINYGGKVYYVMPGGASAYLKFEMKKIKKYKTTKNKEKGRKI